ncbi:MAG: hypothetical protein ACOX2M_00735 [Fastidiosipilaceae bacterium]
MFISRQLYTIVQKNPRREIIPARIESIQSYNLIPVAQTLRLFFRRQS